MGNKVSAGLYIDKGVLEAAHRAGLNVSRVAERALIEAIEHLMGAKLATGLLAVRWARLRAGAGI